MCIDEDEKQNVCIYQVYILSHLKHTQKNSHVGGHNYYPFFADEEIETQMGTHVRIKDFKIKKIK